MSLYKILFPNYRYIVYDFQQIFFLLPCSPCRDNLKNLMINKRLRVIQIVSRSIQEHFLYYRFIILRNCSYLNSFQKAFRTVTRRGGGIGTPAISFFPKGMAAGKGVFSKSRFRKFFFKLKICMLYVDCSVNGHCF